MSSLGCFNGKAILLGLRLSNAGPRDVAASLVLAPSAMQHVEFGLVGVQHTILIKAGSSASAPLLFLAVDRPDQGPAIDLPALREAQADLGEWAEGREEDG